MKIPLALAALGALAAPPLRPVQDPAAEKDAAAALAKAEALVAKGECEKAVGDYEDIAKRWPDTPAGRTALRRTAPNAYLGSAYLLQQGPSSNRVDVVVMGDGFVLKKQKVFLDMAKDLPGSIERDPVFEEYSPYLNFQCAYVVSQEDGIDGYGRNASTALGGRILEQTTNASVWLDPAAVRDALDEMEAQDGFALVFVPRGTGSTGQKGAVAISTKDALPEIRGLGQAFAGLYDEYDVDDRRDRGPTPNDRNIANTDDPEQVPWAHFLRAKVEGVGVYRGGYGHLDGAWRPTAGNCIMASAEFFCPVCRELVVLAIYDRVDPIDDCEPPVSEELSGKAVKKLSVTVMQPKTHELDVSWWVLPEDQAPAPVVFDGAQRSLRRPLAPITADPAQQGRRGRKGMHAFSVDPAKMAPGRYRVICRVHDDTLPRGERTPWVLKDEHGVLDSERSWVLVVD